MNILIKKLLGIALLLLSVVTYAQEKKVLTIESIWKENAFKIESVEGFNALNNGKQYTKIDQVGKGQEINIYQLSDGKLVKRLFEKPQNISKIVAYELSDDEQKLLIFTEKTPIYRRSALYKVWILDVNTQELSLLSNEKVLHASFNPQGTKIAFVQENNLYIYDIKSKQKTAVTTDGEKNKIINGNCDWVYEEEFSFSKAFVWSPNGNYLAYYRFNESRVKEFTMQFYPEDSNYPENYTYKYPKAGEDNSVVTIHIYDVQKQKTKAAEIGSETNQYIPRIKWARIGENLCIYRLNRLQNSLDLLLEDAVSGDSKIIYHEESPYYIDINDNLSFLADGQSFILNSEKDGFNHLYLWNWEKQKSTQLTKGDWDIDAVLGVDEAKKIVYFTAGMDSPMERKLYSVDFTGKKIQTLTKEKGTHQITPCYGFHYFLDRYSNSNDVPVFRLIDAKGKIVRVLEDNAALKEKMAEYAFSPLEFFQIPNEEGVLLNAWMIKPLDFNPQKKYPVLLYQYSGPGSQEVMDKFPFGQYFWHQMLAQQGYIIVCADGTGTGGRGREFKNKTYLSLGQYESDDQIAVGKFMAKQSYVDGNRIGIWGWSYGGFMSSICIMKGAETFKTAIAVAPVTNWRFYDNIYTERYMREPKDNVKGYDENAPEKMASKLKGDFLIIHGLTDDNVHFQNAAVLTSELIKANKQFESEYYPNKNHSIYGGVTREQLFRRMTEFIQRTL